MRKLSILLSVALLSAASLTYADTIAPPGAAQGEGCPVAHRDMCHTKNHSAGHEPSCVFENRTYSEGAVQKMSGMMFKCSVQTGNFDTNEPDKNAKAIWVPFHQPAAM